MRKYAIPAAALVLAASSVSFGQTVTGTFTENFDDGQASTRWDFFARENGVDPATATPDAKVTFDYNYSTKTFRDFNGLTSGAAGAPTPLVGAAPNGGGQIGARIQVNDGFGSVSQAIISQAAILPKNFSVTGDYRMRVDLFADCFPHPNGSTEVALIGFNNDGTGVVGDNLPAAGAIPAIAANASAVGYAFAPSTDGDNTGDYRVYTRRLVYGTSVDDGPQFAKKNAAWTGSPGLVPFLNDNGEWLGSNTNAQEAFNHYYRALTPGAKVGISTAGVVLDGGIAKNWLTATVTQRGRIVTFELQGKIINTVFLPAEAGGKISLGAYDTSNSVPADPEESYFLYDNVNVSTFDSMPTNTISPTDPYARFNSGATVTLNGPSTMNGLQFDTAGTTLAGTGAISLGTPAGAIYAAGGDHSITKPLAFNASTAMYVDEGSTLSITAAQYNPAVVLNKEGRGKLTLNGGIRANGLQISTGTLAVTGGINKINLLNLSFQSATTTPDTGRLDVGRSIWIVDYTVYPVAAGVTQTDQSPFTAIANYINAGFAGGMYNGPGIVSSEPTLVSDPVNTKFIIRGVEASAMGITDGSTLGISGVPVDATSVLFGVTYKSDFNFDGSVEFQDLVKLAQNYNATGLDPITSWMKGDTNFDGAVEFQDLVLVAQTYNQSVSGLIGSADDFGSDWALAQSLVPEPTSLALLGLGGLVMGCRRR